MNICLIGAGGGIGRQLLSTFAQHHAVSAVYRTLPRRPAASHEAVQFSDEAGLAEAVGRAEVVIHAALDTRQRGQKFIDANRAVTQKLLALAAQGECRLFVYFSSQVVYAALDARLHPVQGENAVLADRKGLDHYTNLKLAEEIDVRNFCREHGMNFLIVRPTVVMGPHMQWSSGIVDAMKVAPFGIRNRTINLIHVEDLSAQLLALVERCVVNEVVNLGDFDVSSDDYFRHAAVIAKRPMFLAPNWLLGLARKAIPSTLWFLADDVRVTSDKVKALSGVETQRKLGDFFDSPTRRVNVRDVEAIREALGSGRPYRTYGQGYFLWFNDRLPVDQLIMRDYAGVVGLEGERLTVRSGTTLRAILEYLAPRGLSLATLPEFVDISAGACFFTEVHGSSANYISLYDLITAIRYVRPDGEEVYSRHSDAQWEQLRADDRIVVTEVEFQCTPTEQLANVIEWHPDSMLEAYLDGRYLTNLSTTLHWFPRSGEMMVYNINPTGEVQRRDRGPFAPMRGSPAAVQKLLLLLRLRGRHRIVGPAQQVLAPWTSIPAKRVLGSLLMSARLRLRNMEICIPDHRASEFMKQLRLKMSGLELFPGQGVGIRFTRRPSTNEGFVWIELTSRNMEQMHSLIDMARTVCGDAFWLHRGKYVPAGIEVEHLFIRRSKGVDAL